MYKVFHAGMLDERYIHMVLFWKQWDSLAG